MWFSDKNDGPARKFVSLRTNAVTFSNRGSMPYFFSGEPRQCKGTVIATRPQAHNKLILSQHLLSLWCTMKTRMDF
jgi:hypothetical protein